MRYLKTKTLLSAQSGVKTSQVGGRTVVDRLYDLSPQKKIYTFSGTDRPEFTDFDGAKVCVEAERTNYIPYSEDFTQWTDAAVGRTSDREVVPSHIHDGNLLKVTSTVAEGGARMGLVPVASESNHSLSFFIKKETAPVVRVLFENGAVNYGSHFTVYINLDTGGTSNESGVERLKVVPYADGWLVEVVVVESGADTPLASLEFRGVSEGDSFIFGQPQLEAGLYRTNYIPTSGSPGTRLAPFAKIDRVDIADVFIAFIDDFVIGDESLQRYAIVQTIDRSFGLFTRNNNRLQFFATTAGGSSLLLGAPFPWQPANTRKKWFFSIYVKGTEVQIGMGDPETGDLGTVEAVSEGLNTGSHDLYLSGPGVGPEDYASHYYTAYKNLTGHPKMNAEGLKNLMQSMHT